MERIVIDVALDALQCTCTTLFELAQGDSGAHKLRVRVYNGGTELAYPEGGSALFDFFSGSRMLASIQGCITQSGIECDLGDACTSCFGAVRCMLRIAQDSAHYTLSGFSYYVHPARHAQSIEKGPDLSDATAGELDVIAGKTAYGMLDSGGYGRIEGRFLAIEPDFSGRTLIKIEGEYTLEDGEAIMLNVQQGDFATVTDFGFIFLSAGGSPFVGGLVDTGAHFIDSQRVPSALPDGVSVYATYVNCYIENRSGARQSVAVVAFCHEE